MEICIFWVDLPVDMFDKKNKKSVYKLFVGWWFVGVKLFVGSSYWGNEAVFIPFSRVKVG
jgi:hypothetical protein